NSITANRAAANGPPDLRDDNPGCDANSGKATSSAAPTSLVCSRAVTLATLRRRTTREHDGACGWFVLQFHQQHKITPLSPAASAPRNCRQASHSDPAFAGCQNGVVDYSCSVSYTLARVLARWIE